jgi:hypothetical protein
MIRLALLLPLAALSACAAIVVPLPLPAPAPAEKETTELIGRELREVVSLLGSPSFDRAEGPARQLQFMGANCVMDVFFYPDHGGGRMAATHIEARTRSGQPFDAKACAESLQRPPPTS